MRNLSVKIRLSLWYALVLVIIGAVLTSFMFLSSRTLAETNTRRMLARLVSDNSGKIEAIGSDISVRRNFRYFDEGVHISVYNEDGELLLGELPPDFTPDNFKTFKNNSVSEVTRGGQNYYVYDRLVWLGDKQKVWVRGIISAMAAKNAIGATAFANTVIIAFLILIASIGGYIIASRLLSPVDKITNTAQRIIESNDLSERIALGRGDDEIHRLASTFDKMLGKLEKNFEAEKQFTSDASHELRTPVAVIMAECDYMTSCNLSDDEYREAAADIKEQADRMSKMISELLAMSRLDKGTQKIEKERINISEICEMVCNDQEIINVGAVPLVRDIEPQIFINSDRDMITRIFINIISNAYKYGSGGESIDVSLMESGSNVLFSVTDHGQGIKAENLDKIWDRFYRVDYARTKCDTSSTGLGLSMVKQICELIGATADVESKWGEGSCFTVTIPIDCES